jgi:predicted MFS family arabinose efflux permease
MGAGSAVIGWLVPIREAGALLPQLMVAAKLRAMAQRKFAWALGGTIQGGSALGMAALAGSGVEGALGWGGVLALLTLLSLGRGISSIATKDVMGKTIAKTRRGTLMGWADSASSVIALGIGLALPLLGDRPERGMLAALLVLAGCGWLLNAVCALWMKEEPGATEGGTDAGSALKDSWQLLRDDPAFLRFNISRGLLLGSALSLPYLVVLARERSGSDLGGLGWLIVASSIGGLITSPFWGQWADRSSRHVMAAAGALAAVFVLVALALPVVMPGVAESALTYGVLYGLVATAHGGVRLGRKTWVVDAGGQQRALYVALSNTVTGVLMLVAGAVASGVSALWGNTGVLLLMAGLALVGSASTLWIQDGQAQ